MLFGKSKPSPTPEYRESQSRKRKSCSRLRRCTQPPKKPMTITERPRNYALPGKNKKQWLSNRRLPRHTKRPMKPRDKDRRPKVPFKSQAQQAFFNVHRKKLESQGVNVDEWNQASKGKKLPP